MHLSPPPLVQSSCFNRKDYRPLQKAELSLALDHARARTLFQWRKSHGSPQPIRRRLENERASQTNPVLPVAQEFGQAERLCALLANCLEEPKATLDAKALET